MDVFVASTSAHKLTAAEAAVTEAFPGETLKVEGRKAASGINEQPVGHDETLRGALNRLAQLKQLIGGTRYDVLLAMEGGMFAVTTPAGEAYFDCGWVVAEDAQGRSAMAHCTGVRFDDADVAEARRRGFATATVGSVLAERAPADGTDPHTYLTDALVSRSDVLRLALLGALGQLRRQQADKS